MELEKEVRYSITNSQIEKIKETKDSYEIKSVTLDWKNEFKNNTKWKRIYWRNDRKS